MTNDFSGFPSTMLDFLRELESHNERDWFNANKWRYERDVVTPSLAFISAVAEPLADIAPRFAALPLRSGGSLMRIYRDTRFSRDKRPYKTNVGIQFRHEQGKDVHAPGYYFHIDSMETFVGVGAWRPATPALTAIREHIDAFQDQWIEARDAPAFASRFALSGESLLRPPRGYGGQHPLIDDLKRKSFIAIHYLEHGDLNDAALVSRVADSYRAATPFMEFLCAGMGVSF
jgi:uncharacterized protein (TIGR02453 family)